MLVIFKETDFYRLSAGFKLWNVKCIKILKMEDVFEGDGKNVFIKIKQLYNLVWFEAEWCHIVCDMWQILHELIILHCYRFMVHFSYGLD